MKKIDKDKEKAREILKNLFQDEEMRKKIDEKLENLTKEDIKKMKKGKINDE